MTIERPSAITKELSANDSGETGGHQSGMLIPKDDAILAFFPRLPGGEKNPRHSITFSDSAGEKWVFSFIHYNNKFYGGTRNEFRLTCMTAFLKANNLKAGDRIMLHREGTSYSISYVRCSKLDADAPLRLGSSWRVVPMK